MKNNQDIGSALKSKLEDLQNSPDDFVWNEIEQKLKKKKRRLLFWYFTFGLGILLLALFIFNPFSNFIESDINDLKFQEQNIKIAEQETDLKTSSNTNFKNKNTENTENKNIAKDKNTISNTNNQSPNNTIEPTINSTTQSNETSVSTINSKNSLRGSNTSEKQKLANSVINKKESDKTSQSSTSNLSDNKNSTIADNNKVKSLQNTAHDDDDDDDDEKKRLLQKIQEKASDSIQKNEDDIVVISEEEIENLTEENEKVKDSLSQRDARWSINPQLILSNYGAFNAETSDITSTNYGLLLGVRMTNKTFFRFGVRKLDLKQTVNNVSNNVSYLEFPLEVKYFFRDKKFNPYLTGGISYFMLKDQSSENPINLEYGDNASLNFGLGIEHKLFDRFYINLESNFNYQIEPITSNIDYTPYIFSISTGIDYRF